MGSGPDKDGAGAAGPPQLYGPAADPHGRVKLAGDPAHGEAGRALAALVSETWDSDALTAQVIESQERRRLVFDALMTGKRSLWDYRTPRDDSKDYIRNTSIRNMSGLYDTERRARLPKPNGDDL